MNILVKIFDKTIDYMAYFAGILVGFAMVIITTEVFCRKVFGFSLDWVIPLSGHSAFIITFFAAAWILKKKQHINTDVLLEKIGARKRIIIEIFNSFIGAAVCLFITYRAGLSAIDLLQRRVTIITDDLGLLTSPFMAIIGLGMLFFAIQYSRDAYELIKKLQAGSKNKTEMASNSALEKPEELI
jgi:TRAP-type C4-dicarboxylate transport system permease small subunit